MHFAYGSIRIGALEIDIDGIDPEIAQGLQVRDDVVVPPEYSRRSPSEPIAGTASPYRLTR